GKMLPLCKAKHPITEKTERIAGEKHCVCTFFGEIAVTGKHFNELLVDRGVVHRLSVLFQNLSAQLPLGAAAITDPTASPSLNDALLDQLLNPLYLLGRDGHEFEAIDLQVP